MLRIFLSLYLLHSLTPTAAAGPDPHPARRSISLNGPWQFWRDGESDDTAKVVLVPSVFQDHEGDRWHGTGWYRKSVGKIALAPGRRLHLHFTAAATHAEVWWNDVRLGEHLGGWTPFRFDVTDLVRARPSADHVIRVRLDERVGHNTQGFLPIIQPHFGGLWRDVELIETPDAFIDDLRLAAFGDPATGVITITVPFGGRMMTDGFVRYRLGDAAWSESIPVTPPATAPPSKISLVVRNPHIWSPEQPLRYEIEIGWGDDRVRTWAAFRTIETKGTQLLLNGEPLVVRGVLNWGYYPPRLPPAPDVDRWRRDIRQARAMGFNLMKFCLWLPPREFLELCDAEGMLAWVEYPTWHPKIDAAHRAELLREFAEFFAHDGPHPSVILRSLTCETGSGADLSVIRDLYNLAKSSIPGCVVEDDSSWIEWNRITDFFDDHPYGNNHTWVATLIRLRTYAQTNGPKPLILGEAIAADTWVDPQPLLNRVGDQRPYWLPGFLDGNARWLAAMRERYGPGGLERLATDSRQYAMLMRKFQIETFRREAPDGGYVVSVLRDFPLAAMGLLDYDDRPKWSAEDWRWHGADTPALAVPGDARAFLGGQTLRGRVISRGRETQFSKALPAVAKPQALTLEAGDGRYPIWVVPPARALPDSVVVVRRLDPALLAKLESGARVLLLPDGERGSPPLRDHWFLRGGPYLPDHPVWQTVPREFIVDLQHFDLAGPVIPELPLLDEIDPIVLLWDNHDIQEVKTHGVAFETGVGRGRLLVSALRHDGDSNAAGAWLLAEFAHHLAHGPPPRRALRPETVQRLAAKLRERTIELTKVVWRFRPDPRNVGIAEKWHDPANATGNEWSDIRVGRHWESQGWPTLDGWAWYRLETTIPAEWRGEEVYITFEGVDDHYEVFVNGHKVGTGGDPVTKRTAFADRASHKITNQVKPGESCLIAVRVLDWYGAGGIHRPVLLNTAPANANRDLVR